MKIVVTGPRVFERADLVDSGLNAVTAAAWRPARPWPVTLIWGKANRGVDAFVSDWVARRFPCIPEGLLVPMPIPVEDWDRCPELPCPLSQRPKPYEHPRGFCPLNGPVRNQLMVDHLLRDRSPGDMGMVFLDERQGRNKGTRDCLKRLIKAEVDLDICTIGSTGAAHRRLVPASEVKGLKL